LYFEHAHEQFEISFLTNINVQGTTKQINNYKVKLLIKHAENFFVVV